MAVDEGAATPILVRDIMSMPVVTVDMDDRIESLVDLFKRRRLHHVVVTDRRQVRGVISDRDVLRTLSPFLGKRLMERPQDQNTLIRRAHRIMTRQPVTIGPSATMKEAAKQMLKVHVSCLPVVEEDGELVGIVTSTDILRWFAKTS